MSQSRTRKRLQPDTLGMKALITTTSLTVTLGGWVLLANEPAKPIVVAEVALADAVVAESPAGEFTLNLPPLPTLVAPPPPIVVDTPLAQPVVPAPAAAQPVPSAQPAPAVSQPPLRVVSVPPKPVTRTHSSR